MSRLGRNAALDHEVQFQSQLQDHAQPIDRRRLRVARSERPATFAMAAVERVLDLRRPGFFDRSRLFWFPRSERRDRNAKVRSYLFERWRAPHDPLLYGAVSTSVA